MDGSKVAIITRTKDRPLLLRRALRSVMDQSYKNYVHIIINDAGDPIKVQEAIKEEQAETTLCTTNSFGHMEKATNEGVALALKLKADFVVILDDDDSWSPEFLSIMLKEFHVYEKLVPSVKGILCRSNRVYEKIEGNVISIDHLEPHAIHKPEIGLLKLTDLFNSEHNFGVNQFLYRLDALEVVGNYNQLFPMLGDWDFNLRFLQHYDIALIPNFLAFYHHRIGPSVSSSNANSVGDIPKQVQWEIYNQLIQNQYTRDGSAIGLLLHFQRELQELKGTINELRAAKDSTHESD